VVAVNYDLKLNSGSDWHSGRKQQQTPFHEQEPVHLICGLTDDTELNGIEVLFFI